MSGIKIIPEVDNPPDFKITFSEPFSYLLYMEPLSPHSMWTKQLDISGADGRVEFEALQSSHQLHLEAFHSKRPAVSIPAYEVLKVTFTKPENSATIAVSVEGDVALTFTMMQGSEWTLTNHIVIAKQQKG